MNFYLVDDDDNIRTIVGMIIEKRGLGQVIGSASNGEDALEDLKETDPDIVIADLLMPAMDGLTFVELARQEHPQIAFIMLSQVSSKDMIADAYERGIEFFVQKPVNSVELEMVIKKVSSSLTMNRAFAKMQSLFQQEVGMGAQPAVQTAAAKPQEAAHLVKLRGILQRLGIIGDLGSQDIIQAVDYLITHGEPVVNSTLSELCGRFSPNAKSVEQRIRRAASTGLVNLANLGLEDYTNEIFNEYANTLYNFEQVRKEMDCIRGKSDQHGKVFIKSFLNALVSYCQN